MARDENGAALVSEPAKQPAQPADALRVQPVRRFVQHDRPRVSEQRGGQAEALPHPHRVAADLAPCGITQPDQLEHLVGSRHRQAGHRAEDAQVVARRASRVEARRLERRLDDQRGVVQPVVRQTAYGRGPSSRVDETEHHAQRGGLARAVGPEEAGDRTGFDREAQPVDPRILPRNTFVKLSTTIRPSRGASVMRTPQ